MKQLNEHKPLKVMIVGARSKTAEAIARVLNAETAWKFIMLSSGVNDVEHSGRLSLYPTNYTGTKEAKDIFLRELPDVVVNTAAMTNVDACEENRREAWQANVQWVEFLIRMCKITDARLVQFSTDYIFDGARGPYTETDAPNPINYYGKTKLAGENVCRTANIPCAIIRTNVVYGFSAYGHTDFVRWTVDRLREGKQFAVVTDQFSNPTLTDDLALITYRIIRNNSVGVFNAGGGEWLSRYEFARKIAQAFEYDPDHVQQCTTADLQQKAKRPLNGGLITLKTESATGVKPAIIEAGLITLRRQIQVYNEQQLWPMSKKS